MDYSNIENPYDALMNRPDKLPADQPVHPRPEDRKVLVGQLLENLALSTWIKSKNFKPHVQGFYIDGGTGYAQFNDIDITGGTIKFGKTSFTDSTSAGYFIGPDGIYFGTAGDTTYIKYDIATGSLVFVGPGASSPKILFTTNFVTSYPDPDLSGNIGVGTCSFQGTSSQAPSAQDIGSAVNGSIQLDYAATAFGEIYVVPWKFPAYGFAGNPVISSAFPNLDSGGTDEAQYVYVGLGSVLGATALDFTFNHIGLKAVFNVGTGLWDIYATQGDDTAETASAVLGSLPDASSDVSVEFVATCVSGTSTSYRYTFYPGGPAGTVTLTGNMPDPTTVGVNGIATPSLSASSVASAAGSGNARMDASFFSYSR